MKKKIDSLTPRKDKAVQLKGKAAETPTGASKQSFAIVISPSLAYYLERGRRKLKILRGNSRPQILATPVHSLSGEGYVQSHW